MKNCKGFLLAKNREVHRGFMLGLGLTQRLVALAAACIIDKNSFGNSHTSLENVALGRLRRREEREV